MKPELLYIKTLCQQPTDSNENILLRNYYEQTFGIPLDIFCADCLNSSKKQMLGYIKELESKLPEPPQITNLNGKAKN